VCGVLRAVCIAREFNMKCALLVVAAGLAAVLALPVAGLAQVPTTNSPMAPVTGIKPDRTTAPKGVREKMQSREAVLRKKRAECRANARAEKVPLLKRPAYVKRCMKS
jgi:NCAIR mutase (PurE)-related protein